jgi:superfamily I DNA and/or RNA helicase
MPCSRPASWQQQKSARKFRHELGLNIIDEAGAVTSLESLIVWNGDTTLILVSDNNQLPPPVMTARQ